MHINEHFYKYARVYICSPQPDVTIGSQKTEEHNNQAFQVTDVLWFGLGVNIDFWLHAVIKPWSHVECLVCVQPLCPNLHPLSNATAPCSYCTSVHTRTIHIEAKQSVTFAHYACVDLLQSV